MCAALALLVLLAVTVRARPVAYFTDASGVPILRADDAQYHARRARYTLENFPAILVRDSHLEHPTGAHVPWPPLWDFALAAVAAALGGGREMLAGVLAWAPVWLGGLTLLPVAAAARAVASPGVALGAAAFFAILPVSLTYSSFGNADHHAAVAFAGAALLAGFCWALRPLPGRALALAQGVAAVARVALLLTWQGSLLYLAIGEPLFLAIAGLAGRHHALLGYGFGALASAAVAAPVVAATANPTAPPWQSAELSWLHVLLLAAAGAVALACALWERARPAAGPGERALRLVFLGAGGLGLALWVVGGVAPLAAGAAYLGREEPWIARNFESVPLFAGGSADVARRLFASLAFLLPLCPLAALWRARQAEVREAALLLAGWTAAFVALGLSSARFANDLASAAAVGFALLLAEAANGLASRRVLSARLAGPLALALGVALAWPSLARIATGAPRVIQTWREGATRASLGEAAFHRDLQHFARAVREATPPTAGFLDAGTPEYGVLCFPAMGLALVNVGERPVTASGFGPYLGGESFRESVRFYAQRSEREAVALARRLGARYVATSLEGRPPPGAMLHRLQVDDGLARGPRPALSRFRLVTEAPVRGVPLGFASGTARRSDAPYKLFEVVEGAVLEHRGRPGGELRAEVELRTPGRRFTWAATAVADRRGVARLRVPYPTDTGGPVHTLGAYTVTADGATSRVPVSEAQVREGGTVRVAAPPPG
ncbi:MAG: STT3 domain-containing protein [Myxococcota bacterium]|nr:STT3 domain-containing protein [Myxococcota bacterium]